MKNVDEFDYFIKNDGSFLCTSCAEGLEDGEATGYDQSGDEYDELCYCSECGVRLPVPLSWKGLIRAGVLWLVLS